MNTYDALEAQIIQCYGEFSGTDKKLADVLLSRKSELLGYSATELADLASVSKASAARFFRRLGYADFGAFRQALRDQRASQSPLAKMGRAATPRGARTGVALPALAGLQAHVQLDAHRLAALPEQLSERVLDTTLRELADARRVWVVGYRNSFMLAFYANALLSQVRPEVYLLNEQAGKDAELIAEIDSKDVLLAVDFRRRARRLAPIVTLATEAGAKIILLSDAPVSALTTHATAVLRCSHHGDQVFDSYVAATSLVNYLATAMARRARKRARARMARVERAHDLLDDLDLQA
ncbi:MULTISPECIES: MurR/RpiR family transcriptional regulator [Cupriavidus]|uniref:MurR/RpiR family transcriptional regulator n=1 Tax=Cupriavidus oxalaticus TaxID=96344 RepID=A0A4P7LHG4_9BURK|nr:MULTISPECIES: MurR/RpiR family transcriptional regulator [Cupriavidus]QBY55674.1 MurR/RpiR family transcriptional regulator [Cupriavidus oxalaticus]TDF67337.1 MurR/RpiR family transcriptional regulator [Cupriavidus sp. L7L]